MLLLFVKNIFVLSVFLLVVGHKIDGAKKVDGTKEHNRVRQVFTKNDIIGFDENRIAKTKSHFYHRNRIQEMNPIVVNTWAFTDAAEKAWEVLSNDGTALDAVEKGCTVCEELQCDYTVGYGGSPDENGETTLDAMIMNGETHDVGAVACLRRIKSAISVARQVMERTKHTILAGDLATEFAIKMGFKEESLTTEVSTKMHQDWKNNSCQPNFWKNVSPDPTKYCGPYEPIQTNKASAGTPSVNPAIATKIDRFNHDTISMVALDSKGRIASGTSSNGARNKIPGRVGDAPIVGAGSYVDRDVGGAAATGDGDVMMRFLPSLLVVEQMRQNVSPTKAAEIVIAKIASFYPNFSGAIVAVNLRGDYGAACHNIPDGFPFCVRNVTTGQVIVPRVQCIQVSARQLANR